MISRTYSHFLFSHPTGRWTILTNWKRRWFRPDEAEDNVYLQFMTFRWWGEDYAGIHHARHSDFVMQCLKDLGNLRVSFEFRRGNAEQMSYGLPKELLANNMTLGDIKYKTGIVGGPCMTMFSEKMIAEINLTLQAYQGRRS